MDKVCFDSSERSSLLVTIAGLSSVLIVSEILPFLKSHQGNGLVDCLIICIESSECCLSAFVQYLKGINNEEEHQSQNQAINQNININVTDAKITNEQK
jgi:hypothetical protein